MAFLDGNGVTTLVRKLKTKFQETLVSGTNIKTVNGDSILGSGDLTVGGTDILTDSYDASTKTLTLSILNGSTINNASGVEF